VTGSDAGVGTLAEPYATPQTLLNSLAPGQTGCLRAGTYTFSQTDFIIPDVTLMPYDGETVTLKGSIKVKPAGHHSTIQGLKLNGAGGTSNIGPRIYADGTVLRDNEITNDHTSICVQVSSWYDDPAPEGVVIERNRIHDCGELPSTNKDHGVYLSEARDVIVRDNWIYDNVDRGIQQYPAVDGAQITGNVIFNNGQGINYSGGSNQIVEGNIIANSNLRWNVYAGSTGTPDEGVLRNNCVYATKSGYTTNGGIESSSVFSELDNLVAAPNFSNPAGGDFDVDAGDACLAKYTGTMSLPASPPPPPPRTLTVQLQGLGAGTVTGPGISCPGDCTETYTEGQQVTLAASPSAGSSFAGWGGDCSGTGGCQLTMDADKQASASFDPPPPRTLTVQLQGLGAGTVTGPGISCPGDCTETYTEGQQVTLAASPSAGSSFAGWGGDCSGTGGCQLTMDADKQASASFALLPPPPTGPYTLRPNVSLASGWRVIGATSAWAALDDNVLQPTVPAATDYIEPSAKGQVTTVGFETRALNGAPKSAVIWYYAKTYNSGTKLQLDARWAGTTRATYTLPAGKAYAWRYLVVVPPNQAALDDLNLRLTALGGRYVVVNAAYVSLYV
jgi:hypothetical protein